VAAKPRRIIRKQIDDGFDNQTTERPAQFERQETVFIEFSEEFERGLGYKKRGLFEGLVG
jgi:hypothetical protein